MSEELEQLLKNLKLRRMLEIYEEQQRAAEKQDVSYAEFLTRLLRAQWHYRQENALEYRIRRANLPERWSLEIFPFDRQPAVSRKQIRTFAELDFLAKAENIVLLRALVLRKLVKLLLLQQFIHPPVKRMRRPFRQLLVGDPHLFVPLSSSPCSHPISSSPKICFALYRDAGSSDVTLG